MLDLTALITFCSAALVLLVTPGPAVLYIVARSIDQGRIAGMLSALGLMTGALVHIGAAVAGVSVLLRTSEVAFRSLKYLGAAYLIFLGIRQLRRPATQSFAGAREHKLSRVYSEGILVNLLNPKAAAFFFAFLPQFVDPARGSASTQVVALGGIFLMMALVTDSAYVLIAGSARAWLQRSPALPLIRQYVTGAIYIALGVGTALAGPVRGG